MLLDVTNLEFNIFNKKLREIRSEVTLEDCFGQRFIASGMRNKDITVKGVI